MKINKELSHLREHFLEAAEAPQKQPLFKRTSVRQSGFLPFTLGVNVGWIVSLFLWKLCVKQAEKSGLTVSEWIGQKIFPAIDAKEKIFSHPAAKTPATTEAKASSVASKVLKEASPKTEKAPAKAKKAPAKKAKASSKKTATKKATKAAEKKTAKKTVKAEKTAKKATTAAKAQKKVKKTEDKA